MQPAVRSAAVLVASPGWNLLAQRSRLDPDVVVPLGAVAALTGAWASGLSWDELGGSPDPARSLPAASGQACSPEPRSPLPRRCPVPTHTGSTAVIRRVCGAASGVRHHPAQCGGPGGGALPLCPRCPPVGTSVISQAATVHAVAFGLWHALGATTLADENAGIRTMVGSGRSGAAVGVVVPCWPPASRGGVRRVASPDRLGAARRRRPLGTQCRGGAGDTQSISAGRSYFGW